MSPRKPNLQLRFSADVMIGTPIDVGETPRGRRRVIPITGGEFTYHAADGGSLRGAVLPVGADFQTLHTSELTELVASYVLEDSDGQRLLVENKGIRTGNSEVIAAINRGEPVNSEDVYFMTAPLLSSSSERYAWVNSRLFIATALREPERVRLDFYCIE